MQQLLQDNEVGKRVRRGRVKESRITLLLRGSSSLLQCDRSPGGSPIEKIYERYGKAEMAVAIDCSSRRGESKPRQMEAA